MGGAVCPISVAEARPVGGIERAHALQFIDFFLTEQQLFVRDEPSPIVRDAADALVVGFDDPADIALVVVPVGAECPALGAARAESQHERQGQEAKDGAAGEHDGILARMVTEARLGRLELGP